MRKLTLIIGIYCVFISAETMAESVILNPLQVLNVQTGQLDKTQIMVSNGKSLVITTRTSYYRYPLDKTPLNIICPLM